MFEGSPFINYGYALDSWSKKPCERTNVASGNGPYLQATAMANLEWVIK